MLRARREEGAQHYNFLGLGSLDWKGMIISYLLYNLYESILSINKSVWNEM